MANRYFFKWGIGLLSVSMFTYFLGLSQHLAKSNPSVSGSRLVQNNTQGSATDSIKNEWNASQGQLGNGNASTQGPSQVTNEQGQQNNNDLPNSQSGSSLATSSRAKKNPSISGSVSVQNNAQSSAKDSTKNESKAAQGQPGSGNISTQGPNQTNSGQGQQNYHNLYNSQTQSTNSFIARSRAS